MRALFGVLSLLVVVVIVGLLAKKQLGSAAAPQVLPAGAVSAGVTVPAASGTPQQRVLQYQQAVQGQMEQARPMPDEPK